MNSSVTATVGMTILLLAARTAVAGCASELTSSDMGANLPLPPACRSLGPLHLGMSRVEVLKVLGPPDRQITEPASLAFEYWYSRHLDRHWHGKSESPSNASGHSGSIQVVFVEDKAVNIQATAPSSGVIPYTVGGIAIGEPVPQVLNHIGTWPQWNGVRDNILFRPYPIEIGVVPSTYHRVTRITISTRNALHDSYLP